MRAPPVWRTRSRPSSGRRLQPPEFSPRGWLPTPANVVSDATPNALVRRLVRAGAEVSGAPALGPARAKPSRRAFELWQVASHLPADRPARIEAIQDLVELALDAEYERVEAMLAQHAAAMQKAAAEMQLRAAMEKKRLADQAARVAAANLKEFMRTVGARRQRVEQLKAAALDLSAPMKLQFDNVGHRVYVVD